ncbi:MAG: hypothetical protein JKX74_08540 [Flavobacteriales bacterium]|nr:hypothetical protein [Flavobacteriales bacterium]
MSITTNVRDDDIRLVKSMILIYVIISTFATVRLPATSCPNERSGGCPGDAARCMDCLKLLKFMGKYTIKSGLCVWILIACVLASCSPENGDKKQGGGATDVKIHYADSKPYTRWWWFATEITKPDIRAQLDWVKEQHFGGVEVSWVYPLYRFQRKVYPNATMEVDSSAQTWLSPEWSDMVAFTKMYCDSIGLGCDFTFGSGWPFGASYVRKEDGSKIYGDTAFEQMIHFSWEYPEYGRVIDHMDRGALERYAKPLGNGLGKALAGSTSALLCESWEIKLNGTNKLWTAGFETMFEQRFGYDIVPFMEDGLDNSPDVRYDYMQLISDRVIENFYKPYNQICSDLGAIARVQCLASPTDLMEAYAVVDIPESEAMLNNPNFSRIVSSSACLSGKKTISAESFTCIYGFANTNHREEQTADLKLVADALFANGVNQIFWHGMPYNPVDVDSVYFFATVHVGSDGALAEELPAFNDYLQKVSAFMKMGSTYSDVAVYIPYEDAVMAGAYPDELQRVWVWGAYEMRFLEPPAELEGRHPLWINRSFLKEATYVDGLLNCGDAKFSTLYINVEYLDSRSLDHVLDLAKQGLPVCLKRIPREPGKMKSGSFVERLEALQGLPNVNAEFEALPQQLPLIKGDSLPAYWCKVDSDGAHWIFFAHPLAKNLTYPLTSGQSRSGVRIRNVEITVHGVTTEVRLEFQPYQSLLAVIADNGAPKFYDISFTPKDPVVKPKTVEKMYF